MVLYAIAIAAAAYNNLTFIWIAAAVVFPFLTGWSGYILRAVVDRWTQRYGFKIISDKVFYEIKKSNRYTLSYTTKLYAITDHLMAYPLAYKWSGNGEEGTPKLASPNQQLMAPIPKTYNRAKRKTTPYEATAVAAEGDWRYWFVAFTPPVHKGHTVKIEYSQDFQDKKSRTNPHLSYFVRTSMKKLELSVKFPADALPNKVAGSYVKLIDPNRPYKMRGVVYDKHKQWATWTIHHPKRGRYYRLDWQ